MKSFIQHLTESSTSTPLVVIDLQPAYENWFKNILKKPKFYKLLEQQKKILWFYNGEGLTEDTTESIKYWLIDSVELSDTTIHKISFREKGYGFLRGWMDNNVPDSIIIKVVREMVIKKVRQSDELDLASLLTDNEYDEVRRLGDGIYLPNISIKELKSLSGCYIIGGSESECLREIQLFMSAFNIKNTMIKEFIY